MKDTIFSCPADGPVGPSVTRFGKNVTLAKLHECLVIFGNLFIIWQNANYTLANLWYYLANFLSCQWPNIEK